MALREITPNVLHVRRDVTGENREQGKDRLKPGNIKLYSAISLIFLTDSVPSCIKI